MVGIFKCGAVVPRAVCPRAVSAQSPRNNAPMDPIPPQSSSRTGRAGKETKRRQSSSGIATLLLWAFFACACSVSAAPSKIRLAYPTRSMSLLHIQVAVEKGLFIKHALDVEAIQIRSAVSLPALLSNEIQYMTSIGTGIRAAAKGLPIKVVLISRDSPLFFVVSRVKTIPELREKRSASRETQEAPPKS
jgi:hypothetical protein